MNMKSSRFKETEIGLIPEDWDFKVFSDIVDIVGGGTPKTTVPEYWDGEIPWLSVVDFNNDFRTVYETEKRISELGLKNSSTKLLKKGDLIISARGTVGAIAQLGKDMAFNQSCYGLKAKNGFINDFIYYLLKYSLNILKQTTHGSTFDTITRNTFDLLNVPIPTHEERNVIANILSTIDDKIELNSQTNQTLEEIGQAIFRHWFIHFEFPDENGQPYRSSGGEMVDSEMGEIPMGWDVKKFKDCVELIIDHRGKTPTKLGGKWSSSGIRALSAKNIKNGKIVNKESIKFVDLELYSKWMKDEIKREDILLTSEAPLGEMVSWDYDEKIVLSQRLFGIRANKKVLFPKYLYCFMNSGLFEYELKSRATGSTVQGIRQAELVKTNVVVPPLDLTIRFQSLIEPLFNKITSNEGESQNLSQIRDYVLPKLMSGKIRVK